MLIGAACKRQEPKSTTTAQTAQTSSQNAGATRGIFTEEEWAILSAACERVIPRDQDPGAVDADVPVYIDRMLQTPELARLKLQFLAGTDALGRRAITLFGKPFHQLAPEKQDEVITLFKDSPPTSGEARYFELLMTLTLEGFLGDPSYGGNKDRVGWALVGFGTSEPPPDYDGAHHLHAHRSR